MGEGRREPGGDQGATEPTTGRKLTVSEAAEALGISGDAVRSRIKREMQERIRYLERQVEEERVARRRADTLLARLMDRLPELEAAPEARESPETAAADTQREDPTGRRSAESGRRRGTRSGHSAGLDGRCGG